jgi:uncharacterized membrane protein YdbT with pleckstrin-like domain
LAEGITYKQDKRCKEGEKVKIVACTGPGCDPGEQEAECIDDPEYAKLEVEVKKIEQAKEAQRAQEQAQREQEAQVYQAGRQERAAQRAAMMDQNMALELQGGSPLMMYGIIGGGALLLLVTTFMVMRRKPKTVIVAAPAARRRKRKRTKR